MRLRRLVGGVGGCHGGLIGRSLLPGLLVNLGHEHQRRVSRAAVRMIEVVMEVGAGWFSRESVRRLRRGGLSL